MPLVVIGGPLTFSNPLPAGPFADVIVMGEADELIATLADAIRDQPDHASLLAHLATLPGFYVPSLHGERLPTDRGGANDKLPAYSQIRTAETELSDMFLIEPERGCHRGCTYCVMRRSTNGGMRIVEPARVLGLVPADARRVGLVGAAVTDHPGLPEILRGLVDVGPRGRHLQPARRSPDRRDRRPAQARRLPHADHRRRRRVGAHAHGDRSQDQGAPPAARRRALPHARAQAAQALHDARPARRDHGRHRRARRASAWSWRRSRRGWRSGIAPFVAKKNTPLDGSPFEPIDVVDAKLARLRARVRGRVTIRPTSPKWAFIEYRLAQGGFAAGLAAAAATRAGGRYSDWRSALAEVPEPPVVVAVVAAVALADGAARGLRHPTRPPSSVVDRRRARPDRRHVDGDAQVVAAAADDHAAHGRDVAEVAPPRDA